MLNKVFNFMMNNDPHHSHPSSQAYYGGEARCDQEAGIQEDYDPSELVCGGCSDVSRAQVRTCLNNNGVGVESPIHIDLMVHYS